MSVGGRRARIRLAAGAALAFWASAGLFLLGLAARPARHELVLVFLIGGVYLSVALWAGCRQGPAYGVPFAIAGGLALDSFYIPPLREFGAENWQNWLVMAIYISMAVLIGMLGARSQRRAEASESARSQLAADQAGLRRVATLVAREPAAEEVFAAVVDEVQWLLRIEGTGLLRYEADGSATVVAACWPDPEALLRVGAKNPLEGGNVAALVLHTRRAARIDDYGNATGPLAARARQLGVRSVVGAPIVVKGELWGAIVAGSRGSLPARTEARLTEFATLVATAIANIQARSELAASRARVVAAADEERRRVVRDLHDGAQQRLVHTVVTLKLARQALQKEDHDEAAGLVSEALEQSDHATVELRELAHGILPSVLARGGLRAGVETLASRMSVPVEVAVAVERLPVATEATAYFVVAEALTNIAKHACAEHAAVVASVEDGALRVRVRDDGVGGARLDGSGLVGLSDRLAARGGRLRVESPAGGGTLIAAAIPLAG